MATRIPIHAALAALRARAGYPSQRAYATAMRCAQSAVSRAESGDYATRLDTIQRYADAAGEVVLVEIRPGVAPAIIATDAPHVIATKPSHSA